MVVIIFYLFFLSIYSPPLLPSVTVHLVMQKIEFLLISCNHKKIEDLKSVWLLEKVMFGIKTENFTQIFELLLLPVPLRLRIAVLVFSASIFGDF